MRTRAAVNRVLLALVGLALLAGGLLALVGGLDPARRWNLPLPAGWPLADPHGVLLSNADRTRWTAQGWWWPAVTALLAAVLLLCLWWLLAQLRHRGPQRLPVGRAEGEQATVLRGGALRDAIAAEASRLPGVRRARVRLTGRPGSPGAGLLVVLTPEGEPDFVLRDLLRGPLENARRTAGLDRLPAEARLRVVGHPGPRVR